MRILAIRGRNLASLGGDFEIDFTAEPLASSGIFAITGPTGAGKSTLLDAVSLALYGEIPRLRSAPSAGRIGGEDNQISLRDPRAIMRHGSGDCFAEVDFAMPGGAIYRARWSAKRARGRAEGRLQNNDHAFERLDTAERMGGTRTETTAAIEQVIGLTADQFGRAVLLAQGDFEAFVRAGADERAVLLERLTGSDIYAKLGVCAFEKAKALQSGLDDIRRQISAQNGLGDEDRATAEDVARQAATTEASANATLQRFQAARGWEQREATLAGLLADARVAAGHCETAVKDAEPRRAALARARNAARLVPVWQAASEARQALEDAVQRIAAEEAALTGAETARNEARAREDAAREALGSVTAEEAALAPQLAGARALDLRLMDASTRIDTMLGDATRRGEVAADAGNAHRKLADQLGETVREHAAQEVWLAANAALGDAVLRRDDLSVQLGGHAAATTAANRQQAEHGELEQALEKALATLRDTQTALAEAERAHATASQELTQAEADLPPDSSHTELATRRERLLALEGLLRSRAEAAARHAQTVAAIDRLRDLIAETETERMQAQTRQAELEASLPGLGAGIEQARTKLEFLSAAAGDAAADLRARLQDGEPCPVCGSADHRLDAFTDGLAAQLRVVRDDVEQKEREQAEITRQHGEAVLDSRNFADRAGLLADQHTALVDQLGEEAASLALASEAVAGGVLAAGIAVAPEHLAQAIADQLAAVDGQRAQLQAASERATAARKGEQAARLLLDTRRKEHGYAVDGVAHRTRALEECARVLRSSLDDAERTGLALDRWLAPLGDWRTLADPVDWLKREFEGWQAHARECERLAAILPALREETARAENEAVNCLKAAIEAADALALARKACADLASQRTALLGGEAVAIVEQRLATAREAASAALAKASRDQEAAANGALAAVTRLAEYRKLHDEAELLLATRRDTLAAALAEAGIAEPDVAALAAQGEDGLAAEAQALTELDQALHTANALASQREQDLAAHRTTDVPALLGPELATALEVARGALASAAEIRREAELRLRMDDDVRAQTASLRAELETKTAKADVWLRLNALIGDAKGASFRRFAQGLTLERLLVHANARLSELKPRYTLERSDGGDMLIQVIDNDMGGEVRGLHNLSGGERFLVSLALALGLAEMSTSSGVRIESLFIDEGFGALDPSSLGQAVALLEQLHATGRRVGVISHVEELKERIPVKIEVTPTGRGTSRIEVTGE